MIGEDELPSGFPFEGVLLHGRYQLESQIGQGGMATIYAARDVELGRRVVVKVPLPSIMDAEGFQERFEAEIRGLIEIEHPHVVSILAKGEHEGVPYFVIPFLDGGNLEDRIAEAGEDCLPPRSIMAWLPKVAEALDFVHSKGIIHRDIKPANILFDRAGNVYVSDFGVAKALSGKDAELTATGLTLGSPEYMAPEQVSGEGVGPATDQYALAVSIFECLTGTFPFTGENPLAILAKKCAEDPPPLDETFGLPKVISDVVLWGLRRSPADRYESCSAFSAAYEVALWSMGAYGTPVRTPTPGSAPRDIAGVTTAPEVRAGATPTEPIKRTLGGTVDFTGATLLGHYKVGGRIARGGMGAVYLGMDTDLGKNVVIKVPHARYLADKDFLRRFEREVSQMLRIEHPSIVRVLAKGEHQGVPFFVLQYMKNGSLRDRMLATEGRGMLAEDVLPWFEATAKALDFLHSSRLIHRDVKPGNILFDEYDHAYLADFGIAKMTESEEDLQLTATSTGVGSPRYMAPEQTGRDFEGTADQYALATTVFEAITGALPFADGTAMEVMLRKVQEKAPPLTSLRPKFPRGASDAVARALSANPDDRFPTCRAFFLAFKRSLRGGPTTSMLRETIVADGTAPLPAAPPASGSPHPSSAAPARPPVAQPVAPVPQGAPPRPKPTPLPRPAPTLSPRLARAAARTTSPRRGAWSLAFLMAFVGVWLLARVAPFARYVLPPDDLTGVATDLRILAWAWVPVGLLVAAGHGYLLHRRGVTAAWAWWLGTLIGVALATIALWLFGRFSGGLVIHPMGVVAGAVVGVGLALCQWLALGARVVGASRWVVPTILGAAAGGALLESASGRGDTVEYAALLGAALLIALPQLVALRGMQPRARRGEAA